VPPEPVQLPPAARAELDRLGNEFLERILAKELSHRPGNVGALLERAQVLTRLGRHGEALELDRTLATLLPEDASVAYNLACSLAQVGSAKEALDVLERAIDLGYDDAEHMAADEDLASLRGHVRFHSLLARLRS
jgi:tetratricopeptide (TPR) repeat protein